MNQTFNREILEISIEDIVPNRFQPRLTFDTEALNELANSIKEHGIIQPLVVRRLSDKYEIIAGERRYKAATLVGMKKVPCVVMELTDNESAEVAVIENIQRKEMTPLEEAKAFKKILDKGYLTQDELAKRMGKSQSSIANKLRLLNLDEVVQDAILDGKISERHARSLLKIEDKTEQRNVLGEIINNRLTVRQTDELIKEKFNKIDDVNILNQSEKNNSILFQPANNNSNIDITSIFKDQSQIQRDQTMNENINTYSNISMPEVKLPSNNNTNDVNPQLNIMNNIGAYNSTQKHQSLNEIETLDIFKLDNTNQPPSVSKDDIQNIINPSVFSNFEPTNQNDKISNNSMSIDINNIKSTAQDIIKKQEKEVNISSLLSSTKAPENKFFVDLDMPSNTNTNNMNNGENKIKNTINEINKKIEELKTEGVNIVKEENDLGNTYQIIIRIDK